MESSMVDRMIKPSFENYPLVDTSAEEISIGPDDKKPFIANRFWPGYLYVIEIERLCFDPYGEFGDYDERIILHFLNKILAEREVPRITFTKLADGEYRIVCGEHIVEAVYRAGLSHITGYYVNPLTIDSPPPVSVLPGGKHVSK